MCEVKWDNLGTNKHEKWLVDRCMEIQKALEWEVISYEEKLNDLKGKYAISCMNQKTKRVLSFK